MRPRTCNKYRDMPRVFAALPGTPAELSARVGIRPETINCWLREMHAAGLISTERKGNGKRHERAIPLGKSYVRADHKPTIATWCRVIRLFSQKRMTVKAAARELVMCPRSVSRIVQLARDVGVLRVALWEQHGVTMTPVYDAMPAPSMPKPVADTRAEMNRKYRERRAANSEYRQAA